MTESLSSAETRREAPTLLGMRLSAVLETVAFLALVVAFDVFMGDGKRFVEVSLHPFWIIVLLITVQYGTVEGIMATVLSTIVLYAGNLPDERVDESIFDYQLRVALTPALWFMTAFILGEMRTRLDDQIHELKKETDVAQAEARTITEAYEELKGVKEKLESSLASQLKTSAMTYRTFRALSTLNPALIILNLEQVVRPVLNPKKFSVYSLGPSGLEPATSYGWQENERYIRRFPTDTAFYRELIGKQRVLCVVNPDDEKIMGGEGILAAPLIDPETGEIFGMLKIEEIDFVELNVSNLEAFQTVCELIGMAYANAREHQKSESVSMYSFTEILLSYNFYQIQKEYLLRLAQEARFALSQLTIKQKETGTEFEEALFYLLLKETLPKTAQIFRGKRRMGELFILLPACQLDQAQALIARIESALQQNEILAGKNLVFEVLSLHTIDH